MEESRWERMKAWSVVDTFLGFGVPTRIIFVGMFLAGIIMCISLWLTDIGVGFTRPEWVTRHGADWLRSHAYIPNILAGFTGFLIGVPVAATVLTSFYSQREKKVEIDRVNRLSRSAWYQFRDAAYEFCSEERISGLENDVQRINDQHDHAFRQLVAYNTLLRRSRRPVLLRKIRRPHNFSDLLIESAEAVRRSTFNTPQELANSMRADPDWPSAAWAGVVGKWNILDQNVRLQRLELNLDWFDDQQDEFIRKWMSLPKNPFLEFIDIHGFYPRRPDADLRPLAMMDAAHAMGKYSTMNDDELRTFFEKKPPVAFGHLKVSGYKEAYESALAFMKGLRSAIDHVELAYWPEIASIPSKNDSPEFDFESMTGPRVLGSLQTPEGQKYFQARLEQMQAERAAAESPPDQQSDVAAAP